MRVVLAATAALALAAPAWSDPAPESAVNVQGTFIEQANAGFRAPYQGPNSLQSDANGREAVDVTLFAGVRPWANAEVWIDPEIDQGFGLSHTLGLAAYPNGGGYKVGAVAPYPKLQRLFLRQSFDLGGKSQAVSPDLNQLGGEVAADRIVITLGKMAVTDIFDANPYAHDPNNDFFNWALIDAGTFDYAANAWGYTVGGAAELYLGPFAARAAAFDLSVVPNSVELDPTFGQFQLIGELEADPNIAGEPGAIRITAFVSRARMARFADALALASETGGLPLLAPVRRYQSRPGLSLDLSQQITRGLGVFLRAGWADGRLEPYEFTDIDATLAAGLSVSGERWGRPGDTLAIAGVADQISRVHQMFLNAGGLGILVGDGRLPHPGPELANETYYEIALPRRVWVTFDYQLFVNPAYNRDRGPVSIGAIRVHTQF